MKVNFDPSFRATHHVQETPSSASNEPPLTNPIKFDSSVMRSFLNDTESLQQTELFVLKSFLSMDALMLYCAEVMSGDESDIAAILNYIQNQAESEAAKNLENPPPTPLTDNQETAIQSNYLNAFLDPETVFHNLYKLYQDLLSQFKDEDLMQLFRADSEAGDSLDSYLDNMFAMKAGNIVKDGSQYQETLEEVMAAFFSKIFNVVEMMETEPLFKQNDWSLNPSNEDVANLVHSNIVELILYSELLNDTLPLGLIKFCLIPDKSYRKSNWIKLGLSFYKFNTRIRHYDIYYNLKTGDIEVYCDGKKESVLQLYCKKGKIRQVSGSFNKKALMLKISERKSRSDFERAVLGNWSSSRIVNHLNMEDGIWTKRLTGEQKRFSAKYKVFQDRKKNFLVQKKIVLGEDQIFVSYQFKSKIPIPIGASGVIRNEKVPKSPPIPLGFKIHS